MTTVSHDTTVRVRYADTDKMGVVYNGNYLRYFEIGRTELLRHIGVPYAQLEDHGALLPLIEAHVEYLRPARYDDLLTIRTHYAVDRSPVLRLSYEILLGDDLIARGRTRHTFVQDRTFKPIRPPRIFWEAVEQACANVAHGSNDRSTSPSEER